MTPRRLTLCVCLLALASASGLRADLGKARAEPNLDRRARLALDNASLQLRAASAADKAGDWPKAKSALTELGESVDLAYSALKETGRNPRNARQFKDLEIKLRELLRNLESFRSQLDFQEREQLAPLVDHLREVQDEVILGVLTPGKKKY
jgi:hypothetical protein